LLPTSTNAKTEEKKDHLFEKYFEPAILGTGEFEYDAAAAPGTPGPLPVLMLSLLSPRANAAV
jgi:hypothetical protein